MNKLGDYVKTAEAADPPRGSIDAADGIEGEEAETLDDGE